MDRRTFLRTTGVVSAGGITGLAGCSAPSDGGDETTGAAGEGTTGGTGETTAAGTETTGGGGGSGAPNTVQMVTEGDQFYFDPIGLLVESGETITFRIDSGTHSSSAYAQDVSGASTTRIPDGAESWDSGTLTEPGATFEHTFRTAGTYDYFCLPHKTLGMVARIVVDEPGGPAEGSMPPDGEVPESGRIVEEGAVAFGDFNP